MESGYSDYNYILSPVHTERVDADNARRRVKSN